MTYLPIDWLASLKKVAATTHRAYPVEHLRQK